MKKQAFNPYLPSWEYIPDGEPYVFNGRVYVYGSHDYYNGYVFCMGDYVCWSAPVDDLSDWRYEGVIYPKTADPYNKDGSMCLYAPDVTQGPDGRYYLYYVLDHVDVVSVAVCDEPAGKYEFYGYVHYPDGTLLGKREGDEPQFDPAVLLEDGKVYLYTGFCGFRDTTRHGCQATILDGDMLTVLEAPKIVVPGSVYSAGTPYEGHAFFEAPSIRKIGELYYLVYSSQVMHELCYATSRQPREGFIYGGVIVSNADIGIGGYKPVDRPAASAANNHGGLVKIGDDWYIFYHRHTNGTWYSRQGCAEKVQILPDASIPQVQITSCGLNGGPLAGKGEYPAYIVCNIFSENTDKPAMMHRMGNMAKVMQDGRDGDEEPGYVANITNGTVLGFKYFDIHDVKEFAITVRAYSGGTFEIKTSLDGEVLASIPVRNHNIWTRYTVPIRLPEGVQSIYIAYRGFGAPSLKSFELI